MIKKIIQEIEDLNFLLYNEATAQDFLKFFRVLKEKKIKIKNTPLYLYIVGESHIWQYGKFLEILSCQEISETERAVLKINGKELIEKENWRQEYKNYSVSIQVLPGIKPLEGRNLTLFYQFPGGAYTALYYGIGYISLSISSVHTYPNQNKTVLTETCLKFDDKGWAT